MIEWYEICWEASIYVTHATDFSNKTVCMNVLQSVSDYTTCLEPIRIALAALAAASSASVAERCFSCLQPQVISLLKGWLWLKLGAKSMGLDLWSQFSQDCSFHIVISDRLIKEGYITGSSSNLQKSRVSQVLRPAAEAEVLQDQTSSTPLAGSSTWQGGSSKTISWSRRIFCRSGMSAWGIMWKILFKVRNQRQIDLGRIDR